MGLAPARSLRRTAAFVAVVATASLLAPASARAAAPVSTPTITSPADSATITSSPLTVIADSDAGFVQFDIGSIPADSDFVEVVAGEATGSLSVLGLDGPVEITAADCDVDQMCNVDLDTVEVDVNIPAPKIDSPEDRDFVRNGVDVNALAPGGSLQYFLDNGKLGDPVTAPFDRRVSLEGELQGRHVIKVQQCNTSGLVCDGNTYSVVVFKDTKAPRWTDVKASSKTVFPINDNYKDSTRLSARLSEDVSRASIEIRKSGGPVVRTINLGRESSGSVSANWNGRKANGDLVASGRYTFRFIGKDKSGLTGKSGTKRLQVSDKRLVKQRMTKVVSAKGSFVANASGSCSGLYTLEYPQSRYGWAKGIGYYSRSECNGSRSDDLAFGFHRTAAPKAVRYGALRIDTYGGGAFRKAGPGRIALYKQNDNVGAVRKIDARLGWHAGPSVNATSYLRGGKFLWGFGTSNGNWYDVKEFRVSISYSVLR